MSLKGLPCLLLMMTLRFTCGGKKIWSNIKKSQIIMTMIVDELPKLVQFLLTLS